MSPGDFLQTARKRRGYTQADLAKKLGLSRSAVSQWEKGETAPSRRHLEQLSVLLAVPPHAFFQLATQDGKVRPFTPLNYKAAPLLTPEEVTLELCGFEPESAETPTISVDAGYGERCVGIVLTDNSMAPEFQNGDIVVVDFDVQPATGDVVLAVIDGFDTVFRRYTDRGLDRSGKPVFDLSAHSADYATKTVSSVFQTRIATAIEHRKRLRIL